MGGPFPFIFQEKGPPHKNLGWGPKWGMVGAFLYVYVLFSLLTRLCGDRPVVKQREGVRLASYKACPQECPNGAPRECRAFDRAKHLGAKRARFSGGKQTRGQQHNVIGVATGMTVRCRGDRKRRQCTCKRLSRAIWSSINKGGCCIFVTVRLPVWPRRDNVMASKC